MESKEVAVVETKELSVNVTDAAIQQMHKQYQQLQQFVKSEMVSNTDYGIIPGTQKPSLYKPGAEKLRKIFQLGSRIIDKTEVIDWEKNFAMFSYTVEVFHIPSGKAISQCQGSANSYEKKYKEKKKYKNGKPDGTEPVPIAEILNTLQKMAQKRADVGATISATNASALFTQDIEDLRDSGLINDSRNKSPKETQSSTSTDELDFDKYILKYGRNKEEMLINVSSEELDKYVKWINGLGSPNKGLVAEKQVIEQYLKLGKLEKELTPHYEEPKFNPDEEIPF